MDLLPDRSPASALAAAGDQTLVALFDTAIGRYADAVAFIAADRSISYRETGRLSRALAATLQNALGIAPGDRVAIVLANGLAFPVAALAILRCGAIIVNVNPLYTGRELQHQLQDCGAVAIIADASASGTLTTVLGATQVRGLVWVGDAIPQPWPGEDRVRTLAWDDAIGGPAAAAFRPVAIGPDDIALLQYTGGTTGLAKGAMLRHRNICANRAQICEALGLAK